MGSMLPYIAAPWILWIIWSILVTFCPDHPCLKKEFQRTEAPMPGRVLPGSGGKRIDSLLGVICFRHMVIYLFCHMVICFVI